jgi:hypothetical protein
MCKIIEKLSHCVIVLNYDVITCEFQAQGLKKNKEIMKSSATVDNLHLNGGDEGENLPRLQRGGPSGGGTPA